MASQTTGVLISDGGGEDQPSPTIKKTDLKDAEAARGKLILISTQLTIGIESL